MEVTKCKTCGEYPALVYNAKGELSMQCPCCHKSVAISDTKLLSEAFSSIMIDELKSAWNESQEVK